MRAAALLWWLLWAAPCAAQQSVDFGAALGPDGLLGRGSAVERATAQPVGLAFSLCFDSSTWLRVGVSTAAPAPELDAYALRGVYRRELALLVRLADASGKTLSALVSRRGKGESLRAIAASLSLDYDKFYDMAAGDDRRVLERQKALERVDPLPGGRP